MAVPPGARRASGPLAAVRRGPLWGLALFLLAALLVTPTGLGHSTGMAKDVASDYPGDFLAKGCTSCHGGGKFQNGNGVVTYNITKADGTQLLGNAYEKGADYLIHIKLTNEQESGATNHAGFNIIASAGKLAAPSDDANVQTSKDFTQATHKSAKDTSWTVKWTAPDSGAAVFDIFVNDVNGDGANDPGDQVHRAGFWLTDAAGAQAGAAAAAEAPAEFGISLQQYWIGLIGLAGMIFIMVAGFVYLKFVAPHNTDQKDR